MTDRLSTLALDLLRIRNPRNSVLSKLGFVLAEGRFWAFSCMLFWSFFPFIQLMESILRKKYWAVASANGFVAVFMKERIRFSNKGMSIRTRRKIEISQEPVRVLEEVVENMDAQLWSIDQLSVWRDGVLPQLSLSHYQIFRPMVLRYSMFLTMRLCIIEFALPHKCWRKWRN